MSQGESESCSVVSDVTGVGSLSLLQGIFPTQESNPGLPHCERILYQLSHKGRQRILEWVAYPFSRGSSRPRNGTGVSCIAGGCLTNWAIREAPGWASGKEPTCQYRRHAAAAAKSLQSCPTLCDPIAGSPPGSPVPGILQARTLEWVAISFSNAWKWKVKVKSLSRVWLLATPWTVAYQSPLSMGFSRQEYWSGVPLPSPAGDMKLQLNPWVGKISWRRAKQPTPVFLHGESHGQRSLEI